LVPQSQTGFRCPSRRLTEQRAKRDSNQRGARSAYRTAQLVTHQRADADAHWRELSESADFPDAAQDDSVASITLQRNG
jgi:hypothetical protein